MNTSSPSIPLLGKLNEKNREFIDSISDQYRLTFQEIRELVVMTRDYEMWNEGLLEEKWQVEESVTLDHFVGPARKKKILGNLKNKYESEKKSPKTYDKPAQKPDREALKISVQDSDKKIHGDCPVTSPETVCCNLKTIDAVENCTFG